MHLKDIEFWLEEWTKETQPQYKQTWSKEEKTKYIVENATEVKRLVFRMRSVGRKTWANFLWAFDLEETITLTPINKQTSDETGQADFPPPGPDI